MKSFITAVNQTIMMCLGMVVIGGLVGSGGLGSEQISTLRLRSPGRSFLVGPAIFSVAMAFDRLSRSFIEERHKGRRFTNRQYWTGVAVVLGAGYAVGKAVDHGRAPWLIGRSVAQPIDDFVTWVRDEFGRFLESLSDWVVINLVLRIRDLLGWRPWPGRWWSRAVDRRLCRWVASGRRALRRRSSRRSARCRRSPAWCT